MMRTMKRSHGVSRPIKLVACFLIILTLCVSMFPVYVAGPEEEGPVLFGRVVDEEGQGLSDVKVEVYSLKDAFYWIGGVYTIYISGEFRIYLPEDDTYTLNFSKSGYVKVTKSITLGSEAINLGDIVLLKALRLSSLVLSRMASPGDKLLIPFAVSNIGEEPQVVEFSVSRPEGWFTRILDQTGEVTKVYLLAGETLTLQLETLTPLTSTGTNSLSLTAIGKTNTMLNFTITIESANKSIISCQFPGKSTTPGETVLFQVRVKNPFSIETRFRVAVDFVPPNWTAFIKNVDGEVVAGVTLDSGEFIDLTVEVYVSTGAPDATYSVIFEASSSVVSSRLNLTITVDPSIKPIISCQFPGKSTTPGETVLFQVRVKNPFSIETRFRVAVDSIPLNWTAFVESVGGEVVTEVTLDSSEFVDLIIEVTPPVTARIGEYGIVVKVESSDGKVTTFLPLNITLAETLAEAGEEEVKIVTTFLEVTVEAGKVVRYPITIINSGETDRLLLLSVVESPADWKVAFKSETIEVSGLYLTAGKSENLVVEVTPPSTVKIGSYAIPIQAESEDGAIRIRLELKAIIIGSYALSLESSTLLTSATVGGSTTFTARITNTGQTPVTGLRLNVDTPQGWETSIAPAQVESLKPRESFTFTIVAKTPDNTVAGDYLLTLKGLSDQVESDKVQIRVTATAPTSWGLIGIGIAAVMVVALIVVFKKFRRR